MSPSSVNSTRSSSVRRHSSQSPSPQSSNGAASSQVSNSPNMKAATAAARQHRATNYSSNYNNKNNSGQKEEEKQPQQAMYGDQDVSKAAYKNAPLSRFRELKMKGMDHAKLAHKRKQAAQWNAGDRGEPSRRQASSIPQNKSSPRHHEKAQLRATNDNKMNHDSHDHPLTDDEATLTSVARVLDQEQAFARFQQNSAGARHQQIPTNKSPKVAGADKQPRLWLSGEEKSDKVNDHSPRSHQHPHHNGGIYPRPSSSSEFEPEVHSRSHSNYASLSKSGGATPSPQHSRLSRQSPHHQTQLLQGSHYHHYNHNMAQPYGATGYNTQSPSHNPYMSTQDQLRRSGGSYPSNSGQQFYQSASNRLEDDERTYDYGVKDDESQGSTTFQQQLLEAERKAREQSHVSEGNTTAMSQHSDSSGRRSRRSNHSPRLKSDDPMEHYRETMDNPAIKTVAGVIGAATLGCLVVGPVGMLLGAAAVGIGVGVMQIPEEQRSNLAKKASETMSRVEAQAYSASETLSTSCATTYKDSGIAEHIPAEMSKFCAVSEDDVDLAAGMALNIKSQDSEAARLDQVNGPCVGGDNLQMLKNQDLRKPASPNQSRSLRSKKVACLRHVRIVPVSQIHGLDPAAQPRAWLDVLASADTDVMQKIESMEEILILAKDKQRARIFLEEGILDSLMWILCRFFEKQNRKPTEEWSNPEITPDERTAAKLAANCCVALGKSHCAAIHTEGDLLLMSLYERGTVPEERQLAQMLYEVPHHTRVTKTNDPTIIDPGMEVFALKQLTLPQAEEIAQQVKALADGK